MIFGMWGWLITGAWALNVYDEFKKQKHKRDLVHKKSAILELHKRRKKKSEDQ